MISPANKSSFGRIQETVIENFRKEVGNTSVFHPKKTGNGVFRLHADSGVCKGSTDTPKNATQGCSAALKLGKRFSAKPAPIVRNADGTQRKAEPNDIQPLEYVRRDNFYQKF